VTAKPARAVVLGPMEDQCIGLGQPGFCSSPGLSEDSWACFSESHMLTLCPAREQSVHSLVLIWLLLLFQSCLALIGF
jgi:hypothetical protein